MHLLRTLFLASVIAAIAGCRMPAQMLFSPDGSAAAYRVEDRAYLLDADGKVTATLGKSLGGFAWSADGKTLYAALVVDLGEPLTLPDGKWQSMQKPINPATQPGKDNANQSPTTEPSTCIELTAWTGGKPKTLVRFAGQGVLDMKLSPDGQWLAMVSPTDVADTMAVCVYHLPDGKLHLISSAAGLGMTFTGPSRLAYIEADRQPDKLDAMTGKVVEVSLMDSADQLDRQSLMDVIPSETPYLAAIGDNLLITEVPRSFPAKSSAGGREVTCNLFMWTRANSGVTAIADDIGPLFALSPDGQRVLIEKITPATDQSPAKRELALIRTNGSDGHVLRDWSDHADLAMWPAWRGNEEIAMEGDAASGKNTQVAGEQRRAFPAVLYRLNDRNELQPARVLSETWGESMLPYIVTSWPNATSPVTQPMDSTQPISLPTTSSTSPKPAP